VALVGPRAPHQKACPVSDLPRPGADHADAAAQFSRRPYLGLLLVAEQRIGKIADLRPMWRKYPTSGAARSAGVSRAKLAATAIDPRRLNVRRAAALGRSMHRTMTELPGGIKDRPDNQYLIGSEPLS
jgi:hypothetical protein